MAITIELPGALQPYARGESILALEDRCATIGDVLKVLSERWPGVRDRLMDEQGAVRPHVNIFVDDESIRLRGGLATPVTERSTIVIVPAVSGG